MLLMPKVTKAIDKRTRWRIAAHVRRVLQERGMSQAALVRLVGIDAGNLSKLLSGADDRIGLDFVLALHRKLHIDANVLLDHDPPRKFFLDGQLSGSRGQTPDQSSLTLRPPSEVAPAGLPPEAERP